MTERGFAIGIDDHDWSQEVYSFNFSRASTLRTVRDGGSVRRLPGRRTASMTLTMPRTEDAEALVGTIPEAGRAAAWSGAVRAVWRSLWSSRNLAIRRSVTLQSAET